MPRYLVIQSARLGDLVQTRRLLLTLAERGETHLAVDTGLVPLARVLYPFARLHALPLYTRDAAAAARQTFARNGLDTRVVTGDLRDRRLFPANAFDLVISNPPWFPTGAGKSGGPARSEEGCTLTELCAAAGYLTRPGGRFALVHRPERLPDLFAALRENGLEPKRMALLQHSLSTPPSAALVEAVRQGRPGLEVLPVQLQEGPQSGAGPQA